MTDNNNKNNPIMLRKAGEKLCLCRKKAWDLKDKMQRSCFCALLTDKGDLNKGAVDCQVSQKVIADFCLNILCNVESNSQFKGYRNHHYDVVSHALCSL